MTTIDSLLNLPGGAMPPEQTSIPSNSVDQEGFLRLLVAQLQNQDPLEPLTNEEFVQQLTSFSSLDELRDIKKGIENLGALDDMAQILSANLALQQAGVNAAAVGLIGNRVEAVTDTIQLGVETDGEREIGFTLPDSAVASISLTLQTPTGQTLFSTRFNPSSPPDGVRVEGNRMYVRVPTEDSNGNPFPSGPAQVFIEAETASGPQTLTSSLLGTVSGLDFSGDNTQILVGGTPIDLANVIAVNRLVN